MGRGLEAGLKPVGAGVGKLTGPLAEGATNVTKPLMETVGMPDRGEQKEEQKQKQQDHETLGGKEQTAENPLGL